MASKDIGSHQVRREFTGQHSSQWVYAGIVVARLVLIAFLAGVNLSIHEGAPSSSLWPVIKVAAELSGGLFLPSIAVGAASAWMTRTSCLGSFALFVLEVVIGFAYFLAVLPSIA